MRFAQPQAEMTQPLRHFCTQGAGRTAPRLYLDTLGNSVKWARVVRYETLRPLGDHPSVSTSRNGAAADTHPQRARAALP